MAIKAIDPDKLTPFWHTPEGQGDGEPTSFELRPMDGMEYSYALPGITKDGVAGDTVKYILGRCLLGWRNFENGKGPVKFYSNVQKNMQVMPPALQMELVGVIIDASELDGIERKNSRSQSRSDETGSNTTAGDVNGADTATSPETGPGR